ncbi:MAG: methionine adenosyltransferase, partial [Bacteroidota bacterium]
GYNKSEYMFDGDSCGILVGLHEQSPDIAQGVDEGTGIDTEQGAGDQGMMFGYATRETDEYMPMPLAYSHRLLHELANIRKAGKEMTYLRPDSKSQVTIEYGEDGSPQRIHTIVISTQHDDFDSNEKNMLEKIKEDVRSILIPRVLPQDMIDDNTILHVNPTGKFVIGGPHGDAGLTGRKIIVDTYGGRGAHGGGAFSGKDSSKVDRSAAYATRHVAKNLVAAGVCDEVEVQVAYAIGISQPVSIHVDTYGTAKVGMNDAEISKLVRDVFDLRPKAIVDRFDLKKPIFRPSAAYGHMGRKFEEKEIDTRYVSVDGLNRSVKEAKTMAKFFGWEALDMVDDVKTAFKI